MEDFLFIIYSCQKNLQKAEDIYARVNKKLLKCKVFIAYGDDTLKEEKEEGKIIDDKYIVLNCLDDYDHLSDKTLHLFKTLLRHFPTTKGVFKCDDDVVVNINHINIVIHTLGRNQNNDYLGKPVIKIQANLEKWPDKHHVPPCIYCAGPLYFLSKKALDCFSLKENVVKNYYEDVMVGHHLNQSQIHPSKDELHNLYSDFISDSPSKSYHNKMHTNELYVILKGGLGNQLFQLACAMKMADTYKKKLILNTNAVMSNPHQQHNKERTVATLRRLFPDITVSHEKLKPEYYHKFDEVMNQCFQYTPTKLADLFETYTNMALEGYFINAHYLPEGEDSKSTFGHAFAKAIITPDDKTLLNVNFENTYFIHIRLGDYINHPLYTIPLKNYYAYCINEIKRRNPQAKFYVCTNQFDAPLYNYLKDFPKSSESEYKIQAKSNNDIDTLYIMASCQGGICSNSTMSYMGAYFQKKKDFTKDNNNNSNNSNNSNNNNYKYKEFMYMPYPFVNFVPGFGTSNVNKDMYPEWCSIYDTFINEIMV